MHDLIRAHAGALAKRDDLGTDRDQATSRLLDYYQHTAARADALLARQARPARAPAADTTPAMAPSLTGRDQALAWARAERASLLACLDHATGTGQHTRIIALTSGLAGLWRSDGPWADAVTRHTIAIQAARHLGDRLSQAGALNDLGNIQRMTGDYLAAAQDLEQALGIYRDLGDRLGQANALAYLGIVRRMTGDFPAAVQALDEALRIYRDLGDRGSEAEALNDRGTLYRVTGDLAQAEQCHQQALDLSRATASAWDEAHAQAGLGRCALAAGHAAAATGMLRRALETFQRIGAAETTDVSAELDALTDAPPAVQGPLRPTKARAGSPEVVTRPRRLRNADTVPGIYQRRRNTVPAALELRKGHTSVIGRLGERR